MIDKFIFAYGHVLAFVAGAMPSGGLSRSDVEAEFQVKHSKHAVQLSSV